MTRINSADTTNSAPQIILYNRQPAKFIAAASLQEPDSFKKEEKQTPIQIDPNDKFVSSEEDLGPQRMLCNEQTLGASFKPKDLKDAWKWGKRIWTAAEIYDTLDGYRERFSKDNNSTPEI